MADQVADSRARFERAWGELGAEVEAGIGFRPRPAGLGLVVVGVSAGLALALGWKIFWAELRQGSELPRGRRNQPREPGQARPRAVS